MNRPVGISIEGLAKRYGDRQVLIDVSLRVHAGEVVGLLGPNGAGKTTTVEIVEGYRRLDAGRVEVLGVDPARGGPPLRARVGIMLQTGGIDPRARPRELLELYGTLHDGGRDPGELLELVGLDHVARTPYRRLSGGERQRLALALALIGRPEVLVLDEPTAGMDPEAKRATRRLIGDLRDSGLAVLLTTHDLADVEQAADRVAILHDGRIVVDGTVDEVTAGSRTGSRVRIRTETELDATARASLRTALGGDPAKVDSDEGRRGLGRYAIDGTSADPTVVATVARWAAETGVRLLEVRVGTDTLEDRYFELTGDRPERGGEP